MSARRTRTIAALFLGAMPWAVTAWSAGPWDKLLTANRVDADPKKSYKLTEQNGPWMVMACSFSGENAVDQATALTLELRQRYKLPAYVYEKKFDLGKEPIIRGVDQFGNPRKMKYQTGSTEIEEVAVLVGDYPSVDDPEAQEALRKVKSCQPDCLIGKEGQATSRSLAGYRKLQVAAQKAIFSGDDSRTRKGPMGHAFVTTNPVLPVDYYVPKGLDPLIVKANEGVEHSLLDCPGKYTVQVATFTGRVITDQKEIAAIERGKEIDSQLAKAALMAHKLTEALRMKGYEAYEFHDRSASIVTVGSFGSLGQTNAKNVTELDPRITAVIDQFKSDSGAGTVAGQPAVRAKTLVGIPFDPQPVLVHVPKRSVSASLSRNPVSAR